MKLSLLILSLPTENATVRQRAWRAVKAMGAAALRDGVYVMPGGGPHHSALQAVADEVNAAGGSAQVLATEAQDEAAYRPLFDRAEGYAAVLAEIRQVRSRLGPDTAPAEALKQARKQRRAFDAIVAIDFFPGQARQRVEEALADLDHSCARLQAPDEPGSAEGALQRLDPADYLGRTWATRRRPWVDRLASAWLIRRRIDPHARILWLANPAECPHNALGFDFDGAAFSHVGERVTFQTLTASFGFDEPWTERLGRIVHSLDLGGAQPVEAPGVEGVLTGLRETVPDDDALLAAASAVFDGLLAHFHREHSDL